VKYTQNFFIAVYLYFRNSPTVVRPFGRFLRSMAPTTRSRARMCLLKIKKKLKLILKVFIQKNCKKITIEPMGEIKQLLKRS